MTISPISSSSEGLSSLPTLEANYPILTAKSKPSIDTGRFPSPLDDTPITSLQFLPLTKTYPKSICGHLCSIADRIGLFIKENWKNILFYMLAWSVILACHFPVALSLTVWLGIGFASGIMIGVISATVLDRQNKHHSVNSLWNLLNYGINQLDSNGTRQILLATVISSISTLIYLIPQAVGFMMGTCIGNQLSIQVCYGLRLGYDKVRYIQDQEAYEARVNAIKRMINECQIFKMLIRTQLLLAGQIEQKDSSTPPPQSRTFPIHLTNLSGRIFDFSSPKAPEIALSNPEDALQLLENSIQALSVRLASITNNPDRLIEDEE